MRKIRTERHYDLSATYQDGTYHSSSWASEVEAREILESIRKHGVKEALIWNDLDLVDAEREIVRVLSSQLIHEERD